MNLPIKILVTMTLLILLSGCLSGGGYKASQLLGKNKTSTRVTFSVLSDDGKKNIKPFLGNYIVKDSWGNFTFNLTQVKLLLLNDKLVGEFYPKGWDNPSYRIEFNNCMPYDTSISKDYNDLDDAIMCVSDARENPNFVIGKSKSTTTVKKDNEELFTSIIHTGSHVAVNSAPYVMKVRIWYDAPAPVLALDKVNH